MIDVKDIKGVLFDFGGTLDTDGCHWGMKIWHAYEMLDIPINENQFREVYVQVERTLGKHSYITPRDTFHRMMSVKLDLQMDYICKKVVEDANVGITYDWRKIDMDEFDFKSADVARFYSRRLLSIIYRQVENQMKDTRTVLSALYPQYPMALVSNFYGNMHTVLKEFQLDQFFPHIIESADVGIRKPDPAIFKAGVDALGLKPEEVVMVGDSMENDILPAKEIGCHTIWLEGEGWTCCQKKDAADVVIHSISQLPDILTPNYK